jgi:hypothetical protein
MKKRRSTIVPVLLVLALALGIGYASLSRELVIGSEANLAPDQNDFDIVFTNATIEKMAADEKIFSAADDKWGTASVTGGGKNGHYTLTGLSEIGDKARMTFTITNQTADVAATLMSVSYDAGSLYLGEGTAKPGDPTKFFDKDVIITDENDKVYKAGEKFEIPAGKTATVTITITLKQTVTQKVTLSGASVYLNFQDSDSVTTSANS